MRLPGFLPAACPSSRLLYLLSWGGSLQKSSPASYQLGPQDVSASANVSLNWPEFGAWVRERETPETVGHRWSSIYSCSISWANSTCNVPDFSLLHRCGHGVWTLRELSEVKVISDRRKIQNRTCLKIPHFPVWGNHRITPMSKSQKKSVIKCILE